MKSQLKRMKQILDGCLEEPILRVTACARERDRLQRELAACADDASRAAVLELENRRLAQECVAHRRALARLAEELAEEKRWRRTIGVEKASLRRMVELLTIKVSFIITSR